MINQLRLLLLDCFIISIWASQDELLVSMSHSADLQQYTQFSDSVIMHFHVDADTAFAAFKLTAYEMDLSIFGCSTRNVSVYLKFDGIPVINPDGAKFPKECRNITRPVIYEQVIFTDNKPGYINITAPDPGLYYAATFLSYQDPRLGRISQQGLSQSCQAHIDIVLYTTSIPSTVITEDQSIDSVNNSSYYKFRTPEGDDQIVIEIQPKSSDNNVTVRLNRSKPPTRSNYLTEKSIVVPTDVYMTVEPLEWYYLHVDGNCEFVMKFFNNRRKKLLVAQSNNKWYNLSVTHNQYLYEEDRVELYKEFELYPEYETDSFTIAYKLLPELLDEIVVPINITNTEFTTLKFYLRPTLDVGGSLQYILAFKPQIIKKSGYYQLEDQPKNLTIVGCLHRREISVPTWPNLCTINGTTSVAPIILNSTTTNYTLVVPYPESGTWYASLKLFCGQCPSCACNISSCQYACNYSSSCDCQCQCPCDTQCNSSVIFDVSSRPCFLGGCDQQGECGLFISQGIAYSSCVCTNKYRGYDCGDDTFATPFASVVLEFVLLVVSNIFFVVPAYLAFRRQYYVETMTYVLVFLSSTFYHACDAGENIISFCIVRLMVLQFMDFYSAIVAIFFTLLAMANLELLPLTLLRIGGALVIAFLVTLNRYALWIFLVPVIVGVAVMVGNWIWIYRKIRKNFIEEYYLRVKIPFGLLIVSIGMIIYGLLQTQSNYKYLHSLWHVIMAIGVCLLLPNVDTFRAIIVI